MKYYVDTTAIIDVTKPPYCVDNSGETDCTKTLCQILDDILIRQVDALKKTYEKLIELSDDKKENVYLGMETGKVENGKLNITYPEHEPSNKIVYFPKGKYLVSDTITYSLDNLKQLWYHVPNYENCRNIHFMGESKEETVIYLAENSKGFEAGKQKPLISFCNNEMKLPRNCEFTNVAFMNTVEDITLNCGKNNPGAVGIKYVSSNCGRIENVDITSESGFCGIYFANNTSQGVFANIFISGFDYGIDSEDTSLVILNDIDVSQNKIAGIYTNSAIMNLNNIISENIPAIKFKKTKELSEISRYYFCHPEIAIENQEFGKNLYFENKKPKSVCRTMPVNKRSQNPDDWALVDDFGAIGDGVTDSTRAIQKAMNSGKSTIIFGEGEYLINGKIKIPETVKTIDFLFCSLACGIRLVGGEYDAAFEVAQNCNDILFIENLSAWENFRGHIRLIKHAAKRDIVLSDIHLMSASLYFNSVEGSNVYFDNCFLTTGTYTRDAWVPGEGFVPIYSHIIPVELHGQKVYGRMVNIERADAAMLNENSEILIDGYRIEGSGTALKSINGANILNIFNTVCGCKEALNPVFEMHESSIELNASLILGTSEKTEYNIVISNEKNNKTQYIMWDDVTKNIGAHGKMFDNFNIKNMEE